MRFGGGSVPLSRLEPSSKLLYLENLNDYSEPYHGDSYMSTTINVKDIMTKVKSLVPRL